MRAFSRVLTGVLLFSMGVAHGQTITYSLASQTAVLNDSFYTSGGGTSVFNVLANGNGTKLVLWAYDWAIAQGSLYTVEVGNPNSVQLLHASGVNDVFVEIAFSPDYSHVLSKSSGGQVLVNVTTGETTPVVPSMSVGEFTHKTTGNYYFTVASDGAGRELVAIPVHPNGTRDLSRDQVFLTDIGNNDLDYVAVSANGELVSFSEERAFGSGVQTEADLYVMRDVQAILGAPLTGTNTSTLAPASLADSRITPIRLSSESPGLWNSGPSFNQDHSLVFYGSETNEQFVTEDFPFNLNISDWDVFISNSDGSGPDYRIAQPGNQGLLRSFPSGARFTYVDEGPGTPAPIDVRIFLTNVETNSQLDPGQSAPLPTGETMAQINGQMVALPFTLTDNAVQTTEAISVKDTAGTTIRLVQDQVINFPAGSGAQSISIRTPINPTQQAQLPSGSLTGAIPVVREFGPSGTEFFPAIDITMTYTDDEIAGLDEETLIPYLYNEDTGIFDIAVPEEDIVSHDLENNTIVFHVDHFSTYGLGFEDPELLPASSPQSLLAAILLLILCGGAIGLRLRKQH